MTKLHIFAGDLRVDGEHTVSTGYWTQANGFAPDFRIPTSAILEILPGASNRFKRLVIREEDAPTGYRSKPQEIAMPTITLGRDDFRILAQVYTDCLENVDAIPFDLETIGTAADALWAANGTGQGEAVIHTTDHAARLLACCWEAQSDVYPEVTEEQAGRVMLALAVPE